MKIAFIAIPIALTFITAAPMAQAEGNGDHPAIVARRVIAAQGFDHASAFYRHPAGLSLAASAPIEVAAQAEVVTAKRAAAEQRRPARRAAARD